jgi:hypothetical protein
VAEKIKLAYSLITDLTIFISFVVSLIYWHSIKKNRLIVFFPIYILFSLLIDVHDYFPITHSLGAAPLNIFSIIEFFFFYNFFKMVIQNASAQMLLNSLLLAFTICVTIIFIYFNNIYQNEGFLELIKTHLFVEILVLENIFLVIPVLVYYKLLFRPPYINNLVNNPIFLIMTGIIFCFSITTPILVFSRMIANINKQAYYYLYIINAVGFIIMHIFFIKAFINMKRCSSQS